MKEEKINILIVGQGVCVTALAKKLSAHSRVEKIYATCKNYSGNNELFEIVDIREDNPTELLRFCLENKINLSIPLSEKSIKSDIVSFFQENEQSVFAPTKNAGRIVTDKVFGKKFLYKIKTKTSKFGVFDKITAAIDFLNSSNFPVIINTNDNSALKQKNILYTTIKPAVSFLNNVINYESEKDILIEEYIFGHHFTIYYVTDGYSALPITTVANYKFSKNDDCGEYGEEYGAFAPDYKIDTEIMCKLNNIMDNVLKNLENAGNPYLGILGMDCVVSREGELYINGFKNFMEECSCPVVLDIIEEDLIELINSCINGYFSDEYNEIKTNDYAGIGIRATSSSPITEINDEIDFLSEEMKSCILYKKGATLKSAKNFLYEELEHFGNNIKYRTDIAQTK